jgi:hypothetical protein
MRGFAASEDVSVAVCVRPGTELSFAALDCSRADDPDAVAAAESDEQGKGRKDRYVMLSRRRKRLGLNGRPWFLPSVRAGGARSRDAGEHCERSRTTTPMTKCDFRRQAPTAPTIPSVVRACGVPDVGAVGGCRLRAREWESVTLSFLCVSPTGPLVSPRDRRQPPPAPTPSVNRSGARHGHSLGLRRLQGMTHCCESLTVAN